jgi:hypothetical protein
VPLSGWIPMLVCDSRSEAVNTALRSLESTRSEED